MPATIQNPAIISSKSSNTPLARLTNNQLIRRIEQIDAKERKLTLSALLHLAELDRRRLYLRQGYSSCFVFCVRHLDYSEAAAIRRINAARCIRNFPIVARLFEDRRISMTTISKIHGIITKKNSVELLNDIEGKTAKEINIIVSRFNPVEKIHDRVRPVFVLAAVDMDESDNKNGPGNGCGPGDGDRSGNLDQPGNGNDTTVTNNKYTSSDAGGKFPTAACGGDEPVFPGEVDGHNSQPAHPSFDDRAGNREGLKKLTRKLKYKLEFGIDPELMAKIEKVKILLSTKYPGHLGLETLFEELVDEYLYRHCPVAKKQRRDRKIESRMKKADIINKNKETIKPENIKEIKTEDPCVHKPGDKNMITTGDINMITNRIPSSRHIPDHLRDEVFIRDGGKCTFIGPDGHRCDSEWNLHVDHIFPFSCGGSNSPDNLRLLCGGHNRIEAERILGINVMKDFIKRE